MFQLAQRISKSIRSHIRHNILDASADLYARRFPDRFNTMMEQVYLWRLLHYLDVDCVFDVGANNGQYAEMLRKKALYTGKIISFEPIPELAECVRKKANTDGNWVIFEMALSVKVGTQKFNVMRSDQFSSLGTPTVEDTTDFQYHNHPLRTIEVTVETLDSLFQNLRNDLGFRRPFLKLDTQGFDLNVVKGGLSCLNDFIGIQTELSVKRLYKESVPLYEVIAQLKDHGFDLSAVVPNNEGHFPFLIEIDGIFINRALSKP